MGNASFSDPVFLAAIIEHIAHPIFVKDRESRFVLVNRAFCEMLGRPLEVWLGKNDYDFFPHEQADFFVAKDREMFERGEAVVIEEEPITDAAGALHTLATTKVPLKDARGNVLYLVGIIHDITALKAARAALERANEDLEQRVEERTAALRQAQDALIRKERLAVLGQLAGGVAHQVRNPLAAISNAVQVLARKLDAGADDETATALRAIREEIWSANRIITDLLDYARVRPPSRRPTSLGELLDAPLADLPPQISVERDVPELPRVDVDPVQAAGALANLVRNAVEAMPAGGALHISARPVGEFMHLELRDTGAGVPPEVLQRIFEPLVTSKPLGLGLGLTTARSLVENQGGSIRAENPPGGGARFVVLLPLALEPHASNSTN